MIQNLAYAAFTSPAADDWRSFALDRAKNADHRISMDIGRHPNDLMTSFYVRTPAGFDLEYGYGGVVIDDASWQTATYDAVSIWGHRPPSGKPLPPAILRPHDVSRAGA